MKIWGLHTTQVFVYESMDDAINLENGKIKINSKCEYMQRWHLHARMQICILFMFKLQYP